MSRKDIKVYNLPGELNSRTLAEFRGSVFNSIENGFTIGFQFADVYSISQSSGIGFFFKVLEELKIRGKKMYFLHGEETYKIKSEDNIIKSIDKILEYNKKQRGKQIEDEHEFILQGDINSTAVIAIRTQCEEMVNSGIRIVFNLNKASSISATSGMGFFLGLLERSKAKNAPIGFIYDDKSFFVSEEKEMLELCDLVNGQTGSSMGVDTQPDKRAMVSDSPAQPINIPQETMIPPVETNAPSPVKSGNLEVDFEIIEIEEDKQETDIDEISIDEIEMLESTERIEENTKSEAALEESSLIIEENIETASLEEIKTDNTKSEIVELTGEDLNRTLEEEVQLNADQLPAPRELPPDKNFDDREELIEIFEEFPEDSHEIEEEKQIPVMTVEKAVLDEPETPLVKVEIEPQKSAPRGIERHDSLLDPDVVTPRVFSPIEKSDGFYDDVVKDFDHLLEEYFEPEMEIHIELNHIAVNEAGDERVEHVEDISLENITLEEIPVEDISAEEQIEEIGLLEEPIIEENLLEKTETENIGSEQVIFGEEEPIILEEPVIIEYDEKVELVENQSAKPVETISVSESIDETSEIDLPVEPIEKSEEQFIEDTVELEIEETVDSDDILDDDFIVEEKTSGYSEMNEKEAEEQSLVIEEELPPKEEIHEEIHEEVHEETVAEEESETVSIDEIFIDKVEPVAAEQKEIVEVEQSVEPVSVKTPVVEEKKIIITHEAPVHEQVKPDYTQRVYSNDDSRYNAKVEGGIINNSLSSDFYEDAPAKLSFLDGMQFEEEALFDILNMVRYIHEKKPVGLMKNSDYDSIMAEQQLRRYFKANLEMKYFLEMSGESGFDMIAKRKSTGIEEVKLKFNKLDDKEAVKKLISEAHHIVSDFDTFIIHIVQVPPETRNPIIEFAGMYNEFRFMKKRVGNYPFLISLHQYHNRGVFRIYHVFVNPII